MLNQIDNKH